MKKIAVIGGGFSGLCLLAEIVRQADVPLHVAIYEPFAKLGRGLAYSTTNRGHLLNVRAEAMGLYSHYPEEFSAWLADNYPGYGPRDFVPRDIYGEYIDQIKIRIFRQGAEKGIHILHFDHTVKTVVPSGRNFIVITDKGLNTEYSAVILACGNSCPRMPEMEDGVRENEKWWHNPYVPGKEIDSQKVGHIVILGSGLSMIDALVTCDSQGYTGTITVISPHACVPEPHKNKPESFIWSPDNLENISSASCLLLAIRSHMKLNHDWRDILDGLRPHANDLWRRWTPEMRRKSYRFMYLWNIHRHRIPESMHDHFAFLKEQGRLKLFNARAIGVKKSGDLLCVQTSKGDVLAHLVMNCMGYDYPLSTSISSFAKHLLKTEQINLVDHAPVPDFLQDGFALMQKRELYALGPIWQGYLIESTAVREIRMQAERIARRLVETVA